MNWPVSWLKHLCLPALVGMLGACAQFPSTEPVTTPPLPPAVSKPAKVGLALGGGAARGFAHIGVIQVLEEAGIRPDLVVGTSAGSVVAALYASGKSGRELQTIAESMEEAALSDWRLPLFKPGVLRGEALSRFISSQVRGQQIQEMARPLGIVATDLLSGVGVLFQRGDTATAVRASSAIPAVFQPVSIAGRDYVDGGLVSPIPVIYAKQMGADLVIAVDISVDPQANAGQDTLQVLLKTFAIMGRNLAAFELQRADLVVRPNMAGLASASFESRALAIQAGRQAMLAQLPMLRRLIGRPRG